MIDPSLSSHFAYYERMGVNNNLDDAEKIRNDLEAPDEIGDEIDDIYIEEPKKIRADNERTLLQIPVELLPCPAEVKSVTDRTYTYPSQNEAKDYRNLIQSSSIPSVDSTIFVLSILLLIF